MKPTELVHAIHRFLGSTVVTQQAIVIVTCPKIEANAPVWERNVVPHAVRPLHLPISMEFGHCSTIPSLLKGRSHLLAVHTSKGASRHHISKTQRRFHDFQKSPTCRPKKQTTTGTRNADLPCLAQWLKAPPRNPKDQGSNPAQTTFSHHPGTPTYTTLYRASQLTLVVGDF